MAFWGIVFLSLTSGSNHSLAEGEEDDAFAAATATATEVGEEIEAKTSKKTPHLGGLIASAASSSSSASVSPSCFSIR